MNLSTKKWRGSPNTHLFRRPWYSVKLDAKIREVATRKYPIKYNNRIYIYNTILKEFHTKILFSRYDSKKMAKTHSNSENRICKSFILIYFFAGFCLPCVKIKMNATRTMIWLLLSDIFLNKWSKVINKTQIQTLLETVH